MPTLMYACCHSCRRTEPTGAANFASAAVTFASHLSAAAAAACPGAVWTRMAPACMRADELLMLASHLAVASALVVRTGITSPGESSKGKCGRAQRPGGGNGARPDPASHALTRYQIKNETASFLKSSCNSIGRGGAPSH